MWLQVGDQTPKIALVVVLVLVVLPLAVHGDEDSSGNALLEVNASEILAQIQNGSPVEYDHVKIIGDLDLTTLDLPIKHINMTPSIVSYVSWSETSKVITSPIRINNSTFDGLVSFKHITFDEPIDLSGSNFTKDIDFSGANFRSNAFIIGANFIGANFAGNADFIEANFGGQAYFNEANFRRNANFFGASFIGENFRSGISVFIGANFSEDANFNLANFSDNAYFSRASFSGIAYFNEANFCGMVYFDETSFSEDANFDGAKFSGFINFEKANFSEDAKFNRSSFSDNAYFSGAYFSGANFSGITYFDEANFSGYTDFEKANFSEDANFDGAKFIGNASFKKVEFGGDTSFEGAAFSGYAYFDEANFSGYAYFKGAKFTREATLRGVTFNRHANFWDATFSGSADFEGAAFIRDAIFKDVTFSGEAFFEETYFENLDLRYTKYGNFYIRWNSINNFVYHNSAYQRLIENFKKLGFYDDADECYYQFRVVQLLDRNIKNPLISLFDLGAWIFFGFGKKPLYPILWSIFLIILFGFLWMGIGSKEPKSALKRYAPTWILLFIAFFGAFCLTNVVKPWVLFSLLLALSIIFIVLLMFFWRIVRLNTSTDAIDEYPLSQSWPENISESLIFSATLFLSGTKLFVDPPNIPILHGVSGSFMRKVFAIERVLGALFSIMFFLALTGMVIRPI